MQSVGTRRRTARRGCTARVEHDVVEAAQAAQRLEHRLALVVAGLDLGEADAAVVGVAGTSPRAIAS